MSVIAEVIQVLENNPVARERKNKNKFISRMLQRKYPFELANIPLSRLEDIVVDTESYNRLWRKALQDNPHLRGEDYGDKDVLEQAKEIELGYEVGYHQDIKRLANV